MINGRLTSSEAAARLGIKAETLYAYVSRGVLSRERTPEGSTFDPREVAQLARSARRSRAVRKRDGGEPIFVTELTLIDGGRLYYRGLDAVSLSRERSFEQVAGWLWTGRWPDPAERWTTPPRAARGVAAALEQYGDGGAPIERFTVAVVAAALCDDMRHDLNPAGVPVVGRGLLSTLVGSLPGAGSTGSMCERLWPALSPLPLTPRRRSVLEAALVLSADHELAPSTLAARVAAAFRADPYAVVMTGLGPASGSWRVGSSGAPTEVESLLAEAQGSGPERAMGARLRRAGSTLHGFGMPLYPGGDPRGQELLSRLADVEAPQDRVSLVFDVMSIGAERGFPPPNVDMGLGALSYCAGMHPGSGQAIATLGKVAGWLAHAMEEYARPTQFRSRADYVGTPPAVETVGSAS